MDEFDSVKYPYRHFKIEREQKVREVLTIDEIKKIEELEFDNKMYNVVRDMFLFGCYTGLRVSDLTTLKQKDVKNMDTGLELDFKSFKTGKRVQMPLRMLFPTDGIESKPECLLWKYLGDPRETVFPKRSEQVLNNYLKGIGDAIGTDKKIVFHLARHSFGTYMANKVPLPTLQKLLQHSEIKTTMIYVNMNQKMIKDNLGKINWED